MKRSWKYYNKKPYGKKFRRRWFEDDRYALERVNTSGYEIPKYEKQPIDNEHQFYSQGHLGKPQNPFISENEAYRRQHALEERMSGVVEERNRNLEFPPWPEDYKRRDLKFPPWPDDFKKGDSEYPEVENVDKKWFKKGKSKIPGMVVLEPPENPVTVKTFKESVEEALPIPKKQYEKRSIPLYDPTVPGGVPVKWVDFESDMSSIAHKMAKNRLTIRVKENFGLKDKVKLNRLQRQYDYLKKLGGKSTEYAKRIYYNEIKPLASKMTLLEDKVEQMPTLIEERMFQTFNNTLDERMKMQEDSNKSAVNSIIKRMEEMGIKVKNVDDLLKYQRKEYVDSIAATNRRITNVNKKLSQLKDDSEDMKDRTTLMGYELDGFEKYIKDGEQKTADRFERVEKDIRSSVNRLDKLGKISRAQTDLIKSFDKRQREHEQTVANIKAFQERTKREIESKLDAGLSEYDKRIVELQNKLDESERDLRMVNDNFEESKLANEKFKKNVRKEMIDMKQENLKQLEWEKKRRIEMIAEQSVKLDMLKDELKTARLTAEQMDEIKSMIEVAQEANQYENLVNTEVYDKIIKKIEAGDDRSIVDMKNFVDAKFTSLRDSVNRYDSLFGEGGKFEQMGKVVSALQEAVNEYRNQISSLSVDKASIVRLQDTERKLDSMVDILKTITGSDEHATPQQLNEFARRFNIVVRELTERVPDLENKLIGLHGLTGAALNDLSQRFHEEFYESALDREQVKRDLSRVSQEMQGLGRVTNQLIQQTDGQTMNVAENEKEIKRLNKAIERLTSDMEVENKVPFFDSDRLNRLENVVVETRKMVEEGNATTEDLKKRVSSGISEINKIRKDVREGKKMFNSMSKQMFDEVNSPNAYYSPDFLDKLGNVMLIGNLKPKMLTGITMSDAYSDTIGNFKKPKRHLTIKEKKEVEEVVPVKKKFARKEGDTTVLVKEKEGKLKETYVIPNDRGPVHYEKASDFKFKYKPRAPKIPDFDEFAWKEDHDISSIIKDYKPTPEYRKYLVKKYDYLDDDEIRKHVQGVVQREWDRIESRRVEALRAAKESERMQGLKDYDWTFKPKVDGMSTHPDTVESGPVNIDDPEEKRKKKFK